MDVVLLSRLQFAAATMFHFIFVPLTIISCTFFGVIGLFPNMFPSNMDPSFSLTARNASSSPLTLKIMLIVVVIFLPIVLAYQIWAYSLFKDKVTLADLADEEAY